MRKAGCPLRFPATGDRPGRGRQITSHLRGAQHGSDVSEPALSLDPERARVLLASARRATVLVVGDSMVDRYVVGRVERISPEAPVPVVRAEEDWSAAGGAANVATGVVALGARCSVVTVTGDDDTGAELGRLLKEGGVENDGLVRDQDRPTSVKTRVMARHQQMLRIDRESTEPLSEDVRGRLLERALEALARSDALALVDYDKGVLGAEVGERLLAAAAERGVPSVVDPKLRSFFAYRGAHVFKPNAAEMAAALGEERPPTDEATLRSLRERLDCRYLLLTRGEAGMLLVGNEEEGVTVIPSEAREVFDVSGAGDTVTAVLAASLAAGAGMRDAAAMANFAAGLEVSHLGAVPVEGAEILEALEGGATADG